MADNDLIVICGLGNPGDNYCFTRHNCGFIAVDRLAERLDCGFRRSRFKADIAKTLWDGYKVLLVKPLTYMNNSGEAVRQILDFYRLQPSRLMVIYDDVDVPLGQIRVKGKGSAGSHNGMKSVIQHIGTADFARVRVGIGPQPFGDMVDFVLGTFSEKERVLLNEALEQSDEASRCFVKGQLELAMNRYNHRGIGQAGRDKTMVKE